MFCYYDLRWSNYIFSFSRTKNIFNDISEIFPVTEYMQNYRETGENFDSKVGCKTIFKKKLVKFYKSRNLYILDLMFMLIKRMLLLK